MKIIFNLSLLILLCACGKKETSFKFVNSTQRQLQFSESHPIFSGDSTNQVDILFVIDNSGSMGPIQQKVVQNAQLFMQEFLLQQSLDWKIGLISTDVAEAPYLGFSIPFDATHPDPVNEFRDKVDSLGVSGSGEEQHFDPILKHVKGFPNFLRSDAYLAIIMITDEDEQSKINATTFLNSIAGYKNGSLKRVLAYGAFEAEDFGCSNASTTYAGSPFEEVIQATGGTAFQTCSPDFGKKLADVAKDIIKKVLHPIAFLKIIPIPETIQVFYKGQVLPGGPASFGGKWNYDPSINAIRFHTLDFIDPKLKDVTITFESY